MKESSTVHWKSPNTGASNSSGFTGLPGGYRRDNGQFGGVDSVANIQSATVSSWNHVQYLGLHYNGQNTAWYWNPKEFGFSVRCVKDPCSTNLLANISIEASEYNVCQGTNVTYTATVINGGQNPIYQWNVNGLNVGTNSSIYSYIPANGDEITCKLTSSESCVSNNPTTSNSITMTVYPVFQIGSITSNQSICYNSAPTHLQGIAPTGGNTPYSYQWQSSVDGINFTDIPDATGLDYQPEYLTNTTMYRQIQTSANGCGTGMTNVVTVTVNPLPEVTIIAIPSNNTYTGGIPTTIYLGFGPQSVTLATTTTGGSGFTYAWTSSTLGLSGLSCTSCASTAFTPTEEGRYTFTVAVTNSEGCSSTATIEICVLDIHVPGSNNKVYLCHNQNNPQTLSVSVNAVPAHVPGHPGDFLGKCNQSCETVGYKIGETTGELVTGEDNVLSVIVYPNPFAETFTLLVETVSVECIQASMYDMTGKLIQRIQNIKPEESVEITTPLAKGIYFIIVSQGSNYQKVKVVKE